MRSISSIEGLCYLPSWRSSSFMFALKSTLCLVYVCCGIMLFFPILFHNFFFNFKYLKESGTKKM